MSGAQGSESWPEGDVEIAVRGEADVPKGDHKALKRLRDVILVGATARGPMGQAAASEGNHPGPHVVPDGRHTSVVCDVVVGRRVIEGVDIDVKEGAVSSSHQLFTAVSANLSKCSKVSK